MEEKELVTHSTSPLGRDRSVFTTRSPRETQDLGQKLAHKFKTGDIILLHGELGAGKTTFVQGVARKLNVKSRIMSPTFLLVRKHRGKFQDKKTNLYHIDLYRLESPGDIRDLGLEEIFEDPLGIFLIEWGEKHETLKSSWEVSFKVLSKDRRKITIKKNE